MILADLDFCGLAGQIEALERSLDAAWDSPESVDGLTRLAWYLRQRDTPRALALAADAEAMLARTASVDERDRAMVEARLARLRGEAQLFAEDFDAADVLANEAVEAFAALDDRIGLGDTALLRGYIARERGDSAGMRERFDEAAAAFAPTGDDVRLRIAVGVQNIYAAAAGTLVVPEPQTVPGDHPGAVAVECFARGLSVVPARDLSEGTRMWTRCFQAALESGFMREAVLATQNYASTLRELGDESGALDWGQQGLELARQTGRRQLIGYCLVALAEELMILKRPDAAREMMEEGLALSSTSANSRMAVISQQALAEIALGSGDHALALEIARKQNEIATRLELFDLIASSLRQQASALCGLGRPEEALEAATRSLDASIEIGHRGNEIESLRAIAEIRRRFDLPGPAPLEFLERALRIAGFPEDFNGDEGLLYDVAKECARDGEFERAYDLAARAATYRDQRLSQSANDRATALQVRLQTERARLEADAMRAARDAAEEADRAKSAFLAAMSHEIRTPMNAISGMTELLALSPLDTEQRAMLALVQESAAGLLRVIDDILDFSKIEAGKLQLEREPFSPAACAEAVVDTLRPSANKKGIALEYVIARPLPRFFGDSFRFRQILFNLVGNALKFTEAGSVVVEVKHAVAGDGQTHLQFSVADTGIGISSEAQARLFQAFSQADGSTRRRFGGTGLGLSISQRLAEAMGGHISVTSTPGAGSTFSVDVALDVAGPDDESADRDARRSAPQSRTFPGLRALIAEDQPAGRNLIERQMAVLDVTATIVEDGAQAFAAYRSGTFDLLITDCHMPEIDGFELTRLIRREERGGDRRLPILALTANALQGEAEACIAAGMSAYVSKPASLAQLAEKIAALVGNREAPAAVPTVAVVQPPRAAEPAVDLAALGALIGESDTRELLGIVEHYLASCDRPLERARAARDASDANGLRQAAHAGKGSALNVCAQSLAEAWRAVEDAAAAGDVAAACAHLPEVEALLAGVRTFAAGFADSGLRWGRGAGEF